MYRSGERLWEVCEGVCVECGGGVEGGWRGEEDL